MKAIKIITFILAIIAGFFIGATCKAQSFTTHKTAPYALHQGTMNKKTFGQKLRNKIKYNRKRAHNEWFSIKERRRDMKRRGFKV